MKRCARFNLVGSLLILVAIAVPISSQTPPPVLTLDGGEGISATLSDYSLRNAGQAPNGEYQGTYCFTLTNTSTKEVYVGALGLRSESPADVFTAFPDSYNTAGFTHDAGVGQFEFFNVSAVFLSAIFPDSFAGSIAPGQSGEFCLELGYSREFSLEEVLGRTTLLFGDEENTQLSGSSFLSIESLSDISIFTFIQEGNTCFDFSNTGHYPITGIAMRSTTGSGPTRLVKLYPRTLSNERVFSFRSPLRYFPGTPFESSSEYFDFGFLTGPRLPFSGSRNALLPREESPIYCINGTVYSDDNFDGTDLPTEVWFDGRDPLSFSFYHRLLPGSALRGTVATVPR